MVVVDNFDPGPFSCFRGPLQLAFKLSLIREGRVTHDTEVLLDDVRLSRLFNLPLHQQIGQVLEEGRLVQAV